MTQYAIIYRTPTGNLVQEIHGDRRDAELKRKHIIKDLEDSLLVIPVSDMVQKNDVLDSKGRVK